MISEKLKTARAELKIATADVRAARKEVKEGLVRVLSSPLDNELVKAHTSAIKDLVRRIKAKDKAQAKVEALEA